jgi:hypothetical protein
MDEYFICSEKHNMTVTDDLGFFDDCALCNHSHIVSSDIPVRAGPLITKNEECFWDGCDCKTFIPPSKMMDPDEELMPEFRHSNFAACFRILVPIGLILIGGLILLALVKMI